MRPFIFLIATLLLTGGQSALCLAQQPSGPRTLENLLHSDEAQKPAAAAVPVADATDDGPKRPAGTVTRPKDGVQHPDLDKAWADYDAAVAKVTESMKAAIAKQFDAATAKGDLDAAEKWQAAIEKFEKAVELPTEKETKAAVSAAVADFKKAKEELTKVYEVVVKSLTMEKKIAEAKALRSEWKILSDEMNAPDLVDNAGANRPRRPPAANGLLGEYFSDRFGRNKVGARMDKVLSFDWGHGAPDGLPPDDFSVRWSGVLVPPQTGDYIFTGQSDDGFRFSLDGKVVCSDQGERTGSYRSAPIPLTGGEQQDIVIEYYERGGGAHFTWEWIKPDGTRELVPSSCLIPATPKRR